LKSKGINLKWLKKKEGRKRDFLEFDRMLWFIVGRRRDLKCSFPSRKITKKGRKTGEMTELLKWLKITNSAKIYKYTKELVLGHGV
jgi:predicted NUDIX family NTP pyrophosphohydrolase